MNLVTYQVVSNQRNVFEQVVAAVGQGLPIRGAGRIQRGTVSKSAASRMWVEKVRNNSTSYGHGISRVLTAFTL